MRARLSLGLASAGVLVACADAPRHAATPLPEVVVPSASGMSSATTTPSVRLVPGPLLGVERYSSDGVREFVALVGELDGQAALALVGREGVETARVFPRVKDGRFLGSRALLLRRGEDVLVVDGARDTTLEGVRWPPALLTDPERAVACTAARCTLLDASGARVGEWPTAHPEESVSALRDQRTVTGPSRDDEFGDVVLRGPDGVTLLTVRRARHVVASPDRVAFASEVTADGGASPASRTVTAYDVSTAREIARVTGPLGDGAAIAVSGRSQTLAVALPRGDVELAPFRNGKRRRVPTLSRTQVAAGFRIRALAFTGSGELCAWTTDSTGREGSCEAAAIIDVTRGSSRATGPGETCLLAGLEARVIRLPTPPAGQHALPSGYSGPGGICGVVVTGSGQVAVRLEARNTTNEPLLTVYDLNARSVRATLSVPALPEYRPFADGATSSDGRLLAWFSGDQLRLMALETASWLGDSVASGQPARFSPGDRHLVGAFDGAPLLEPTGAPPREPWPASGAPRCGANLDPC